MLNVIYLLQVSFIFLSSIGSSNFDLISAHRRQACLDEVQRLRVERFIRAPDATSDKGKLTIRDITVPLKQEYIKKLAQDTINGHNLVCLLKYNEHVLATKTVPTLPGLLAVKFPDVLTLNNVYADFKVFLRYPCPSFIKRIFVFR